MNIITIHDNLYKAELHLKTFSHYAMSRNANTFSGHQNYVQKYNYDEYYGNLFLTEKYQISTDELCSI